ncbi:unnamed protein product [Pleuronectes platessa]|uniref:Uncharacterized protein n=1 Tax=Pleuronectes platessa TaxID=8262 RepID=A0A9N7UVU2_PLEPL|nr:unnamed protein product [Pleuronectes platessa]
MLWRAVAGEWVCGVMRGAAWQGIWHRRPKAPEITSERQGREHKEMNKWTGDWMPLSRRDNLPMMVLELSGMRCEAGADIDEPGETQTGEETHVEMVIQAEYRLVLNLSPWQLSSHWAAAVEPLDTSMADDERFPFNYHSHIFPDRQAVIYLSGFPVRGLNSQPLPTLHPSYQPSALGQKLSAQQRGEVLSGEGKPQITTKDLKHTENKGLDRAAQNKRKIERTDRDPDQGTMEASEVHWKITGMSPKTSLRDDFCFVFIITLEGAIRRW